jgi:peptide/nickel transport system permease protein
VDPVGVVASLIPVAETGESIPLPRRRKHRPVLLIACMVWLGAVVLLAIFAGLLPLPNPDVSVGHGIRTLPFHSWDDVLGTDSLGRSELSRLIFGARVSLFAGVSATIIALCIGLVFGLVSGYMRGRVDTVIGVVIDALLAIPGLVLLMSLGAVLGASVKTVIIGLSLLGSVWFARLARSSTIRISTSEYVAAARGLGAKTSTILAREILPGVVQSVVPYAGVVLGSVILAEAALSYLGLGVVPPTPSWGNMISDGTTFLATSPMLVFVPGVALFLTLFSVNIISDWLRRRWD